MNGKIGSTKNIEPEFFKKENIPLGRSIKINLKISDTSFNTFKALKIRQGCKTSKEVFNFIYHLAKTIEEPILRSEFFRFALSRGCVSCSPLPTIIPKRPPSHD